jgi:hypothetical protein
METEQSAFLRMNRMRTTRLGLLLVLIPATIGPAAYILSTSAQDTGSRPAPKTLEAPQPGDSSDESRSQAPQHSPGGEVIGVPMLA